VVICLVIKPIVTYKGDRATISSNKSTLVNESALITANFIMIRKILDGLTILSTILTLGILGGSFVTYRYIQSPQLQQKVMNKILGEVKSLLPNLLDKGLPDMTGPSVGVPKGKDWTKF